MSSFQLIHLLGLLAVLVIAVGAVLALLRVSDTPHPAPRNGTMTRGYPPAGFPARELVHDGPLLALSMTQARLLAVAAQLPPHSDLMIWLRTFLVELRQIMDTAYRVSAITQVYGRPAQLDALVAEVQSIEAQVAEHIAQRLLTRDGDAHDELLDGRMAALRLCARELAHLAGAM